FIAIRVCNQNCMRDVKLRHINNNSTDHARVCRRFERYVRAARLILLSITVCSTMGHMVSFNDIKSRNSSIIAKS
ncbi:hypothetical protein L9F63_024139, partial [Diploptera punctata]